MNYFEKFTLFQWNLAQKLTFFYYQLLSLIA